MESLRATRAASSSNCALAGSKFVFGEKLVSPSGPAGFVFAFRVLPTVIFVAALFAVLYHLGVMQRVVRLFAVVMAWLMGTSGAESLDVAASLFLGQTEAPLTIRPYLPRLTNSELLTVMTAGMAHVSGGVMAAFVGLLIAFFPDIAGHLIAASVMSAPAALAISKVMYPETEVPVTQGEIRIEVEKTDANVIDAAARGASEGLGLALNVGAMLLAFISLIALVNTIVGGVGGWFGLEDLTIETILGYIFAPVMAMIGVPWSEAVASGSFVGQKLILNEFVAFTNFGPEVDSFSPRTVRPRPASSRSALTSPPPRCTW